MRLYVPPSAYVRPASVLANDPLRRLEQVKALHDAGVITSGQMLEVLNVPSEAPKCPHGVGPSDCDELDCTVDWVHAL